MLSYTIGFNTLDDEYMNAELLFDGEQWGEIRFTEDKKSVNLIIYLDTNKILRFNYDEFLEFIEKAKKRLLLLEPLND